MQPLAIIAGAINDVAAALFISKMNDDVAVYPEGVPNSAASKRSRVFGVFNANIQDTVELHRQITVDAMEVIVGSDRIQSRFKEALLAAEAHKNLELVDKEEWLKKNSNGESNSGPVGNVAAIGEHCWIMMANRTWRPAHSVAVGDLLAQPGDTRAVKVNLLQILV